MFPSRVVDRQEGMEDHSTEPVPGSLYDVHS